MSDAPRTSRWSSTRDRVAGSLRTGRRVVAAAVQSLPGLLAVACTVAGVWLLAGVGWALLAAVPYLLILDHRAGGR